MQTGGVTVHSEHPFETPPELRRAARRLRGRLAQPVTAWTSARGGHPAGLTVSSMLVADGTPAHVLGLIDPDSELADALEASGRGCVSVLRWPDRQLAEALAGLAPAPGGPFRQGWIDTDWGPVVASAEAWCGFGVLETREVGWSRLVIGRIEHIELTEPTEMLWLWRGRYRGGPETPAR